MIELFRKGFRLDIARSQVVTFKKAINLNGIQGSYSYSNTFPIDLTANNRKLLDLPELPGGKLNTLQNGYVMDVVLNGSIQLRNQIVKVTKESKTKADIYVLYSDSSIVLKLKSTLINDVVSEFRYKKTFADFVAKSSTEFSANAPVAYVQTQSNAGQYVIEEMPQLIRLSYVIKKMLADIGYTLYGDFTATRTEIGRYLIAPNAGIYQIYDGTGEGFAPNFDKNLTAFDLLSQTLAYFNCYASIDDTAKAVIINRWTNLGNYKDNFKDYSKYFVDYSDFTFQSKLAKTNDLTYADSENTFNSFFTNPLSSQDRATYLASKFGSGSTQLFSDSEVFENDTISVRENNEIGETSAVRIYTIDTNPVVLPLYGGGVRLGGALGFRAASVPMRAIYNEFHKAYTDFILTPLIQNLEFKYDAILAAEFSLTEVFFIEQQSAYWIPLEISFSTKADKINVRAMLIKSRKVVSPTLNNFNAVLLDFKQKVIFTKAMLLSMYPFPVPNEYPWEVVIFKSYDQLKNRVFVNNILLPANALPQAFNMSDLSEGSIVLESNDDGQSQPNTLTDSLYLQALDTNGGISNEAYITLKHTGVAKLESNFLQSTDYEYEHSGFRATTVQVTPFDYMVGLRPNINNTITSASTQVFINNQLPPVSFNLVAPSQSFQQIRVEVPAFEIRFQTTANVNSQPKTDYKIYCSFGSTLITLRSGSILGVGLNVLQVARISVALNNVQTGQNIKVYFRFDFASTGNPLGPRVSKVELKDIAVNFTTTINS